ncbi:MAG: ABC transporter permease [Eubacteriales bacterium]|nr:ABC transporter permease [Eubacteriales bacterium]
MKKALHKDFWMEIRKSKARFISIFFIVALGVAFFSGIQAASPDMRLSGDAYYDASKLMDVKVVGTLGLTEDDVSALSSIKGVQSAEGAYSTDVMCGDSEVQKVVHVESVNTTVNQLTATEGRLPEKSGECFLDHMFADSEGYEVGDTISFRQEEDSGLLKTEVFTVVGVGSSPLYISFNRGNTTLGSGEINGFAYVMPEDFDQDIYTQIYVRVHGAEGLTSYTDAYDNLITKLTERIEGVEAERCQIRYDSVVADARKELDDARKELEDGKKDAEKELADARKEIKDGEKKLKDGKKDYEDGKQQLEDAKAELEDGRRQLEEAKKEVADGWTQLEDAKDQTSEGWAQLNAGKEELNAGWAEANASQKKLDDGYAQLKEAKDQLAAGKQKIQESRNLLDQKQAELDAAKQSIADGKTEIENTTAQLNETKQQCLDGLAQVEAAEAQLAQGEAALDEARAQLDQAQDQYDQAVASGQYSEEELAQMQAQVAEMAAYVEAQAAELEGNRQQLAAQRSELENGLAQVEAGFQQLEIKRQELNEAEAQIGPGQQEIDNGRAQLEQEEKKLAPAEKEIAASQKKLDAGQAELDKGKQKLYSSQAVIDENEAKLNAAQAEIDENEQKLASGEQEIADNEKKLSDGEQEIEDNEQKLADAAKDIEKAEKDLKKGKKEYQDGKKEADEEIADGEKKLADAQKELDDLEVPEWIVTDRNDLPEYSDYGDNAERIRNIGQVFPVIFFLVAALISLTTMTRMVEEQRTQIGTMKALGYGKYSIASKYLNYAFLATVGGSILGVLIGEKILPYIIIKAYGIMYHNMASNLRIHYEFKFAVIASAAAVVCTLGATIVSCYKALLETPASLMRPPSPKEGKRVLIERVTILWKHLSFTWKSTLRNLFRYKKRLLMTIFGIAGSMALMLVGFGLQDSIMDIAVRQYEQLQHYDGTIISDEDATKKEQQDLLDYLEKNQEISHYTPVQLTKLSAPRKNSSLSVYIYVPEDLESFHQDVTLQNRVTKEPYRLTDQGAAVSEKTASLLNLKVGDTLTLKKSNKDYQVKVAVITENYMGHYVYMTPATYEETFHEKPDYSDIVFTMKEEYKDKLEDTGKQILEYPGALSISYTSSLAGQLERMLSSLKTVIVVLIVSAGMLAFVVLYNLNNINITERQRELATLKVLGFFDKEVSQYVFRENILLTLIGVLAGAAFGILLHRFVIVTVEVDAVMFGRNIKALSFVYSGLFTCGFSAFVNMVMHYKLKKIDMVESLKSVE